MTRPLYPHVSRWKVSTLEPSSKGNVIVEAGSGSTPPTDNPKNWGGNIYWLTPKEVAEQNTRYFFASERTITDAGLKNAGELWPAGTVMVTKRAPVGYVVMNKIPMATNQGFLNFRCGQDLLPEYLYYWFQINTSYLDAVANGSTYQEIYVDDLFEFEIALPPIEEQQNIVKCLRELDNKIEQNQHINHLLRVLARTIYVSWFVNFDPVLAKNEGQQPYGVTGKTATIFPNSFEESELGPLPKKWQVVKLCDLLVLEYGKALKASNRKEGSIAVYGSNGQVGWHTEKLVGGPGIVVGRKGNPGMVTWAPGDFFPIDTTFYVARKNKKISLYFLYYALCDQSLDLLSGDSAVPGLNRELAYQSKQILPSEEVMAAFDSFVQPIFDAIYFNEKETISLRELRDTLLPKLLSDKIKLSSVENFKKKVA